tara:strand:- start:105 stop:206 length:102 start_codon:yes stop_codon:yes gene_type:complete
MRLLPPGERQQTGDDEIGEAGRIGFAGAPVTIQ